MHNYNLQDFCYYFWRWQFQNKELSFGHLKWQVIFCIYFSKDFLFQTLIGHVKLKKKKTFFKHWSTYRSLLRNKFEKREREKMCVCVCVCVRAREKEGPYKRTQIVAHQCLLRHRRSIRGAAVHEILFYRSCTATHVLQPKQLCSKARLLHQPLYTSRSTRAGM